MLFRSVTCWPTARDLYRTRLLSPELSGLSFEASVNNALRPDGSIDLHSCAAWPIDCVMLQRVEPWFGNGDLIYTPAEQQRGRRVA